MKGRMRGVGEIRNGWGGTLMRGRGRGGATQMEDGDAIVCIGILVFLVILVSKITVYI